MDYIEEAKEKIGQPNSQTNMIDVLKKYYEETINKLECIHFTAQREWIEGNKNKPMYRRGNKDEITALALALFLNIVPSTRDWEYCCSLRTYYMAMSWSL